MEEPAFGWSRQAKRGLAGLTGLAVLALVSVAVLSGHLGTAVAPRASLFALDPDELAVNNDAILQSLATTPSKAAKSWGDVATMDLKSASSDSQMLKQAQADEDEANELAGDDQAQLQALYSGTFSTGDSLGLHTGSLGNYDTLQALQGLPKMVGASMNDDHGDLSAVTQTQLNGLTSELQSLSSSKQSIVNSLALQRQSTAAKMASDAMYADHVRLNRATATTTSRQMRAAMRAAQMAEQRAREASVIQANQDAIAKLQMQRVAALQGQSQMALAAAADAESQMRAAEAAKRAGTDRRYQSAMAGYTSSLQGSVADDMLTLNHLKVAEEAAAPGPHVISSVWSKPPMGSTLPDVDPNGNNGVVDAAGDPWGFMNDAPLRDPDSLMDPEYKQSKASTMSLAQTEGAKGGKGGKPAVVLPRRAGAAKKRVTQARQKRSDPFIMRVLSQADSELKSLKASTAQQQEAQASSRQVASQQLHSSVDTTLQQLTQKAHAIGIDVTPVDRDFVASPGAAADAVRSAALGSGGDMREKKLATQQHFTSFALTSKGTVRTSALSDASMLDDGAVIINARRPVARIAIPLGAHQDATKDRKEGRSWRSLRRAPKATIKDRTFEASAVRADGSHHPARKSSGVCFCTLWCGVLGACLLCLHAVLACCACMLCLHAVLACCACCNRMCCDCLLVLVCWHEPCTDGACLLARRLVRVQEVKLVMPKVGQMPDVHMPHVH
jgi:hypothetical protein